MSVKRLYRNYIKYPLQRLLYGYSDDIYYNLDVYLAEIIAYHLEEFKERSSGYPMSYKNRDKWEKDMQIMIDAFRLLANRFESEVHFGKHRETVEKGTKLFQKHFENFWI